MRRYSVLARVFGLMGLAVIAGCASAGAPVVGGPTSAAVAPSAGLSDMHAPTAPDDTGDTGVASSLGEIYSFTWIRGFSPDAAIARIAGRPLGKYPWQKDGWQDLPGVRRDEAVVAVTESNGWTLLVAQMDMPVSSDEALLRLSVGGRLVAVSHNFEAADRFAVADDGVLQVDFDPANPAARTGANPDSLVADMRAAGFDFSGHNTGVTPEQAAFVLAERITGVHLTARLLSTSKYLAAAVPDSSAGAVNDTHRIASAGP